MVILTTIAAGCVNGSAGSSDGLATALKPPLTRHAEALVGEDVNRMRSTGRDVLATYDAWTNTK